MAPPTGSSSSPTSFNTDIYFSAETPQVLQLNGVNLQPRLHSLLPWMIHDLEIRPSCHPGVVHGVEHSGITWISVGHFGSYGSRRLRLIHNACGLLLKPWGCYIQQEDRLKELHINDGDFVLHAPPPGLHIPVGGQYFPPGALQIIVDDNELQITNEHTTLPAPHVVSAMPCSGWCKRQHIYINHGMTEKAVIIFNNSGWPIACRENVLIGDNRALQRWWRYDYSRPMPGGGL